MNTIEKKYNEALERAKAYYHELHNCGAKDELESIFPELRESEDERIRKVIYKLMLGMREEIFTSQDEIVTKEKVLAWLEEQKDKNCLACDQHLKGYLAGRKVTEEEKQKEQKPAEWSEEDKRRIDAICELLENTSAIHPNYSHRKLIIWLKFLRPSWKPTEEQMEAFKGYIEDFQARAEAAVGGWNNFDVMIRLYEQLKKLREDEK